MEGRGGSLSIKADNIYLEFRYMAVKRWGGALYGPLLDKLYSPIIVPYLNLHTYIRMIFFMFLKHPHKSKTVKLFSQMPVGILSVYVYCVKVRSVSPIKASTCVTKASVNPTQTNHEGTGLVICIHISTIIRH